MKKINNYDYLLSDLTHLKGVGKKTMQILKKKKINNIFDLEEEMEYIMKLVQELQNRRSLIKESVDQLRKSTDKHISRGL